MQDVTAVASVFALGQWLLIYGTQYTSGPMQVRHHAHPPDTYTHTPLSLSPIHPSAHPPPPYHQHTTQQKHTKQVLLSQAAIPFSMGISSLMLGSTYRRRHYAGALLVCGGIILCVGGQLGNGAKIDGWFEGLWILGYVLSWAPIALYTVYSELLYKKKCVPKCACVGVGVCRSVWKG